MMSTARTYGLDAKALDVDRRPERQPRRAQTVPQTASSEHPLPRRAYGSASTAESDPFSEIQPWASLFHSTIWSPDSKDLFPVDVLDSPIGIEEAYTMPIDDGHASRPSWVTTILDPTTLDLDFDHSCLHGLDDDLLLTPKDAFAATCWDSATLDDTLLDSPQDAFAAICWQNTTIAHEDIDNNEHPLRQERHTSYSHSRSPSGGTLTASGFTTRNQGTEESDDSDSDTIESYYDDEDCSSIGTVMSLDYHGPTPFLDDDLLYPCFKDEEQVGSKPRIVLLDTTSDPYFLPPRSNLNHDKSKSVGHFPTPTPRRNVSVTRRIAAFCSTIPTKLTLPTVSR